MAIPPSGPAHVLNEASSPLTLDDYTPAQAKGRMPAQVEDVATRLMEAYRKRVDVPRVEKVYAVFHSPWITSKTVSYHTEYEEPIVIDESAVAECTRASIAGEKEFDTHALFEASATGIWLNGYPVSHPEGKQASTLEMSSIISSCEEGIVSPATAALEKAFGGTPIVRRSLLRSTLSILAHGRESHPPHLFIDIGADATHIAALHECAVSAQRVVPQGSHAILAKIANQRIPEEALGLIRMLGNDACEGDACDEIQKAMSAAEPELVKLYGDAISSIATSYRAPNTLVLFAHRDMTEWLSRFFARIDFTQFTVTTLPFNEVTAAFLEPHLENALRVDPSLAAGIAEAVISERE